MKITSKFVAYLSDNLKTKLNKQTTKVIRHSCFLLRDIRTLPTVSSVWVEGRDVACHHHTRDVETTQDREEATHIAERRVRGDNTSGFCIF